MTIDRVETLLTVVKVVTSDNYPPTCHLPSDSGDSSDSSDSSESSVHKNIYIGKTKMVKKKKFKQIKLSKLRKLNF